MKYTLKFRLWHWFNALMVLGLLGTVLLRKTFFSWRENSEILLSQLASMDIVITTEQAKILAKAVRAGMWEWHIILGYGLATLVLFRLYIFISEYKTKTAFSSLTLHKKLVTALYYLFYAALTFMAISGLVIHFYEALAISKDLAHDIKELHETVFNVILYFVPIHLTGVILADIKEENGLISSMIHGKG